MSSTPRYRTRYTVDAPINTLATYTGYATGTCTNQWPGGTSYAPYNYVGTYRPMDRTELTWDYCTPDFHRRSLRGEIINLPFEKRMVEKTQEPIKIVDTYKNYAKLTCGGVVTHVQGSGREWVGELSPSVFLGATYPATPALSEECIAIAISEAWSRASLEEVQALPAIAESQKTIRSVIDITGRAVNMLRDLWRLSKGKTPKAINAKRYYDRHLSFKQLQDRWMESRYAIRPLVYDILGVAAAINRPLEYPPRLTFRGSESTTSINTSLVKTATQWLGSWEIWARKETNHSISARTGVLTAVHEVSSASIWGLAMPFEAVWELVPYSFVLDWFFNVGQTLASWTPLVGLRALTSWLTVRRTVLQTARFNHFVDLIVPGPYCTERTLNISGGCNNIATVTTTRTPNPNRSVLPSFSLRLDASKLLDLAIMGKRFLP